MNSQKVNKQYGRDNLANEILATLENAGKDLDNLTRADLGTFDEFHIGGLAETRNLATRIPDFKNGCKVLDMGSGLGGPSRTLAAEFDCEVVGIDLTEEYVKAASKLTERVGLSDKITFQQGDVLDMSFDDNSFDVVWTQFVGMNIEDKRGFYKQAYRVVSDGGYLAFHEVMAGETEGLIFPVFWADAEEVNHLRAPATVQETLENVGFEQVAWIDLTQESVEFFEKMLAAPKQQEGKPLLGVNIFVGEETSLKAQNIIKNLDEGRIKVAQAVYKANK